MMRRIIASLTAVLIAGCSGAGAPLSSTQLLPQANAAAGSQQSATLDVTLRIPRDRRSGTRGARYISSSTKSIVVSAKAGKTTVKAFANTTPTSRDCKGTLLALTCTVSIKLKAATYSVAISTYDATQTKASGTPSGHLLSSNTVSAKVRTGKKNAIHATLDAVPSTVTVTAAANDANVAGNDGSGLFTLGGSHATILVAAYDVDGNVIVGGGAPSLSIVVSAATGGINTTPVGTANANAFTLSSTGMGTASLLAEATPVTGTAVSVTAAVTAVTTTALLAGVPGQTGSNDGTGSGAHFFEPLGIAYNPGDGNLYVADSKNCVIRRVTTGGVVTTVTGAGSATHCDSSGSDFYTPAGVAYDPDDGYLYVADYSNCTIDRVPLTTGTFSRIAGLLGNCNGTGTNLKDPTGIAYAGSGTLYVSDLGNCVIRKIATIDTTPTTTTLAGTVGTCNDIGSDFHDPAGIAYDGAGTLYVADEANCEIRKIVISGPTVSTLAGSIASGCNPVDGIGASAGFYQPYGLAYDASHAVLYETDLGSSSIRMVTTGTGQVTTIAGAGRPGYQEGSLVQSAMMTDPEGLVYVPGSAGALGTVYFSDLSNDIVRQLNL